MAQTEARGSKGMSLGDLKVGNSQNVTGKEGECNDLGRYMSMTIPMYSCGSKERKVSHMYILKAPKWVSRDSNVVHFWVVKSYHYST